MPGAVIDSCSKEQSKSRARMGARMGAAYICGPTRSARTGASRAHSEGGHSISNVDASHGHIVEPRRPRVKLAADTGVRVLDRWVPVPCACCAAVVFFLSHRIFAEGLTLVILDGRSALERIRSRLAAEESFGATSRRMVPTPSARLMNI